MPMPQITREALLGSIAKWQSIVDGTGRDLGAENCSLCRLFNRRVNPAASENCEGCPVAAKTGSPYCEDTPYVKFAAHEDDEHDGRDCPTTSCGEGKAIAQEEVQFLQSLLEPPQT
jgi:hypothetical protein